MRMNSAIVFAIGLVMLAGCAKTDEPPSISSTNSVTSPDGDEVGKSVLERATDGITLKFNACCVTPGNAYTAWWLIGDVELSMTNRAIQSELAMGFVADSEQVELELALEAGPNGIEDPNDGIRLAVLDHGPDIGDPDQLTKPGGGCSTMCPVVFRTAHPAP